jgi:hypothetical protein
MMNVDNNVIMYRIINYPAKLINLKYNQIHSYGNLVNGRFQLING